MQLLGMGRSILLDVCCADKDQLSSLLMNLPLYAYSDQGTRSTYFSNVWLVLASHGFSSGFSFEDMAVESWEVEEELIILGCACLV